MRAVLTRGTGLGAFLQEVCLEEKGRCMVISPVFFPLSSLTEKFPTSLIEIGFKSLA